MAFTGSYKCTTGKTGFLSGTILIGHTFKVALYTSAATNVDATTTGYAAGAVVPTGECAAAGGYAAGGVSIGSPTAGVKGTAAYLDFTTDASWTIAGTLTARGALLYDSTVDQAVLIIDFGSDMTVTAGTFKIVWPVPSSETPVIIID